MQEENRNIEEQAEPLVAVGADGVVEPDAAAHMEAEQQPDEPEKKPEGMGRRDILHLVCGGYLLYLAYKLAMGFVTEFPQTGWTTNLVVGIVGAVAFTVVGVILLVGCVRRLIRRLRG